MAKKIKESTATLGFEDKLWHAADLMRGKLPATQYRQVLMGLLFLRVCFRRFRKPLPRAEGGGVRRRGRPRCLHGEEHLLRSEVRALVEDSRRRARGEQRRDDRQRDDCHRAREQGAQGSSPEVLRLQRHQQGDARRRHRPLHERAPAWRRGVEPRHPRPHLRILHPALRRIRRERYARQSSRTILWKASSPCRRSSSTR